MATCRRSDEDRTAEIKEKVEPASWDCDPLIVRYVALSWPSKLFKQNRWPKLLTINSSINQCSLFRKNSTLD